MSHSTRLVQKLWNYCNILRDDALSNGLAEVERQLSLAEELEAVPPAHPQCATRLRQSILTKGFTGELT